MLIRARRSRPRRRRPQTVCPQTVCPQPAPARSATPPYWREEDDDDAEDNDNVLADPDYTESASTSRKHPRARYGCDIPDVTFVRCWAYATPGNGLGCDQMLDVVYNSATREFICKDERISFSSITKMSEYHYVACGAPNPRTGAWNKCQYYHRATNAWRPLVQLKAASASECHTAKLARRDA